MITNQPTVAYYIDSKDHQFPICSERRAVREKVMKITIYYQFYKRIGLCKKNSYTREDSKLIYTLLLNINGKKHPVLPSFQSVGTRSSSLSKY
jgi:hypothetical protein